MALLTGSRAFRLKSSSSSLSLFSSAIFFSTASFAAASSAAVFSATVSRLFSASSSDTVNSAALTFGDKLYDCGGDGEGNSRDRCEGNLSLALIITS